MTEFQVGDRVRQTDESEYDANTLPRDEVGEITDIYPPHHTYPYQVRFGSRFYLFMASEIERVTGTEGFSEGDRVTVTLTGLVIGRGTRYLSIKIDGNESGTPADRTIYITHDNTKVQIKKEVSQ
jgi:hypothetical protein